MRIIDWQELIPLAEAAKGSIDRIYLHWTAGHYHQAFNDYHLTILGDGAVVSSTDDLTESKAHTWQRNGRAIGISLACCYLATSKDLGPEPPTELQIEQCARVVALLCLYLDIEIGPDTVLTHAEVADLDGYGPATTCERWDLAILHNGDAWMSGGDILRGKAIWYEQNGVMT